MLQFNKLYTNGINAQTELLLILSLIYSMFIPTLELDPRWPWQ